MRILFFLLAILFAFTGVAQNSPPSQLRFNHLFLKDGLIEGRVHPIVQDNQGYMWMGTHNGLVRYDGYSPKTYLLNGLQPSRTKIADIHVDKEGNLWIGTYFNGLYKYNRSNDTFVLCVPDAASKPYLQAGEIMNITDDRHGNIWFVLHDRALKTESVFSYSVGQGRFTQYSNKEQGNQYTPYTNYFSPLIRDNNGNIWCGSDHGLKEFDYSSNRFMEHATNGNAALQEDVSMLCVDKQNPQLIWMAIWSDKWDKFEGIGRFNMANDSMTIFMHPRPDTANAADDFIYGLTADAKGNLWTITSNNLIQFDISNKRFTNHTPPGAAAGLKNFYDFGEAPDGNLWLLINGGSISGDLAFFNTTSKKFTRYASGGAGDEAFVSPHDLYLDRSGTVWFGVGDKGVQWVNIEKSSITLHAATKGKQADKQQLLFFDYAEAPDGALWFTTDAGLCRWLPATDTFEWVSLPNKKGLQPLMRSTILADKEGRIWSGVISGGFPALCCYNPASKTSKTYVYRQADTVRLTSNRFTTLLQDKAGNIWMGNYGVGLARLDQATGTFIPYPHISGVEVSANGNQLDDNDVQCLYEDSAGNIWVGTVWGSLNRLDKHTNTFTSLGNKTPLLKGVLTIFEDSGGNLWAGTYTNGLFLIDRAGGSAKRISEADGLLYNEVQGILEDERGNLWLKSARGISIYNPQSGSVRHITSELVEDEMLNPLAGKLSDGSFIFSSKGGFVTLHPAHFTPERNIPVVHIESVVASKPLPNGKVLDSVMLRFGKKEIRLRYNQNKITFEYVGLLYQNTTQVKYKYKLNGFDEDWVAAGTKRTVTYANLPPGRYTFHVMAANSAGLWSRQNDAVTFVITPPFWQTWWFTILSVTAAAGLVALAIKAYLVRRLKAQQQEFERQKAIEKVRAKISMDIHDEISSGLTKISLLSQRVKTKYERHQEVEPEIIDKIAGSSRDVITNLGEIIWAVNPRHDNLQSLLAYLRNYTTNFFDTTPIEVAILFPEEVPSLVVSPDVKHHLFLVVKEALNNIVKHAEATKAELCFDYDNEQYTVAITDNGKGMQHTEGRTFGNGFINMKKRMEAIGGNLFISSEINRGTQIKIKGRFRVD